MRVIRYTHEFHHNKERIQHLRNITKSVFSSERAFQEFVRRLKTILDNFVLEDEKSASDSIHE